MMMMTMIMMMMKCLFPGEPDHNTKLQWYKYLLRQLPAINYQTMKFFASHLYRYMS